MKSPLEEIEKLLEFIIIAMFILFLVVNILFII